MESRLCWLVERDEGEMWPTVLAGPFDTSDTSAMSEVIDLIEDSLVRWMMEEGGTQEDMPDYGLLEMEMTSSVLPIIQDFDDSFLARRWASAAQKLMSGISSDKGSLAEREDEPPIGDPAYTSSQEEEMVLPMLPAPPSGVELEEVFIDG